MIFSTTHTRVLANIFANAFACGTGKGALLATHRSIPVVRFFAILSSLIACFNLVMLLQNTARSTWADAGRFFRNRLRVWHRQARAFCHASFDSRGPHPCALAELGRLLQMGHVGPCYCSMGGGPRARLHGLGMPGALSNPCAQRAVLRRAAPAVAQTPRACWRSCRASNCHRNRRHAPRAGRRHSHRQKTVAQSEQSETESSVDAARAQASHIPTRQT